MKIGRIKKIIGILLIVIAIAVLGVLLFMMRNNEGIGLPHFLVASFPMIVGLSLLFVEGEDIVVEEPESPIPEVQRPIMKSEDPQAPLGTSVDQTIIMPKYAQCPHCHNYVDDTIDICPFCGERLHGKVKKQGGHGVKTSIQAIQLTGEEHRSGTLYVEKRRKQEVIRFVSEQGDELTVHDLSDVMIRIAVQDGASKLYIQDEFYYLKNDNISHFVEYLANNHPDHTEVSFN